MDSLKQMISDPKWKKLKQLLYPFTSLRWKLFFTHLMVSMLPLLFFGNQISSSMETYFMTENENNNKNSANRLAENISRSNYLFDETKKLMFDQTVQRTSAEANARMIVVDAKAFVVSDSGMQEVGKVFVSPEIINALNKKTSAVLQENKTDLYVAVSILNEKKEVIGAVLSISSDEQVKYLLDEVRKQLLFSTVALSVLVVILVFFVSQLIIKPLKSIVTVVKKMSDGHLNERVTVRGHDEFAELGSAFNDMTEELGRVEASRQEFVSNVSHELKTPLSSIKVLGESILLQENVPTEMYCEFFSDIISEVDRMANIINELLALVRLDQTEQPLNIETFQLNSLVEDIFKRLSPLAEQKDIKLLLEHLKIVNIEADEIKLTLAISNLVENGIKYTPNGGSVKVVVDSDHQHAFLTVIDTGIGIAEEYQSKVFARFYRVDKNRDRQTGGTGLGLAITHKTILLHKGSIKLTSKENEGSSFLIRLPLHYT